MRCQPQSSFRTYGNNTLRKGRTSPYFIQFTLLPAYASVKLESKRYLYTCYHPKYKKGSPPFRAALIFPDYFRRRIYKSMYFKSSPMGSGASCACK